jgi:hypothetical protein
MYQCVNLVKQYRYYVASGALDATGLILVLLLLFHAG